MSKSKSVYNEPEWYLLFELGGMPDIYVNAWDFVAKIMVINEEGKYVDVTKKIPNGRNLAEEAVYAAGGSLGRSGWYPPTKKILRAVKKLFEKGQI